MAAIKVLSSYWRILVSILGIGMLFVPHAEAVKAWSTYKVRVRGTESLTIQCPANVHIIIKYGEYGNRVHNCSDVFNQHVLAEKCNYREKCDFPQVGEELKTSCPEGVENYLNLHYICVLGHSKLNFYETTNEDDIDHEFSCPNSARIHIADAFFTDDQQTCSLNVREDFLNSCSWNECSFFDAFFDNESPSCAGQLTKFTITYICKINEQLITQVQRGRRGFIECPEEFVIDIFHANYSDPLRDCNSDAIDAYIKKKCSLTAECYIEHTLYSNFPSGCDSHWTELLIAHRCVRKTETRKFTVIQNALIDLSCFHPGKIKIIHATYGRRKEKCGSETAMERLVKMCDGMMRCCGTANANTLGNTTCPDDDIQKLRVTYGCIEDGSTYEIEELDKCETIRFKISKLFGDLTSESYTKMDQNLILMIGTSLPSLRKMSLESYEGMVAYMKNIPSLEVIPDSKEERIDSYYSEGEGLTDLISRTKSKYEAIAWYDNFINNTNILKDAHVDIEYLANTVTETGVAVNDVASIIVGSTRKYAREIDIAILRFPDILNPYFLVYNIHIIAWRISDRVLFYEVARGGLKGLFRSITFRPNKEYLKTLRPDILSSATEEAEELFD